MKKIISFFRNEEVQRLLVSFSVLSFIVTAGYYGIDMFLMYHNPLHLIITGMSIAFFFIVMQSILMTLKLCVYYPVKKSIKSLIAKW